MGQISVIISRNPGSALSANQQSNLVDESNSSHSLAMITAANQYLERLYAYVREAYPSVRFIEYPSDLVEADENHKWGPSPYHYRESFYLHTLAALGLHFLQPIEAEAPAGHKPSEC